MKKITHWDYLEPSHLVGGVINAVVYSVVFAIIGAFVAAYTGHWWWSLVGVALGPVVSWWDVRHALKRRQELWEGDV